MKHVILGIFADKQMVLNLDGRPAAFDICEVDMVNIPEFGPEERFTCLSPLPHPRLSPMKEAGMCPISWTT